MFFKLRYFVAFSDMFFKLRYFVAFSDLCVPNI